jgi:nucleotide-binding universal stress UspA family protein
MSAPITKILTAVDASDASTVALHAAVSLANAYKASLYVHHVVENAPVAEKVKLMVNQVLNTIPHQYTEGKGGVYKEIISKSLDLPSGLIVMGTHGNSGFQDFWLGSNANKVVNSAKCPVLTIRAGVTKTQFRKIILPMDSSFETRQKVPMAINLAEHLNASIHILGVSTSKDKETEHTVTNYMTQASYQIQDHKIVHTTAKRLGGNITNATISYAQEIDADLIIIMTEQEPQIGSFFLGKFAQQMVNNSPVPVLVVPTRDDILITDARL